MADEMKQTIADLTGESPVESVRGKAAGTRLSKWAQRYIELTQEEGKHRRRSSSDESFFDRYQNVVIFVIVIAILILQLAVFFAAVYGTG